MCNSTVRTSRSYPHESFRFASWGIFSSREPRLSQVTPKRRHATQVGIIRLNTRPVLAIVVSLLLQVQSTMPTSLSPEFSVFVGVELVRLVVGSLQVPVQNIQARMSCASTSTSTSARSTPAITTTPGTTRTSTLMSSSGSSWRSSRTARSHPPHRILPLPKNALPLTLTLLLRLPHPLLLRLPYPLLLRHPLVPTPLLRRIIQVLKPLPLRPQEPRCPLRVVAIVYDVATHPLRRRQRLDILVLRHRIRITPVMISRAGVGWWI